MIFTVPENLLVYALGSIPNGKSATRRLHRKIKVLSEARDIKVADRNAIIRATITGTL